MSSHWTAPISGTQTIFDVGLHRGEDTAFYLTKGFRVIAIEASPSLCALAARRFQTEIAAQQLVIVNAAITSNSGLVQFFESSNDQFGTTKATWVNRNRNLGAEVTTVRTIQGIRLIELIETYGCPYYIKIDIEGADCDALHSLAFSSSRPKYLSLESEKVSWEDLVREFDFLCNLGYKRFKIIPQHTVSRQKPPYPAREGRYVDYQFPWSGSSGLFGEETPGRWLNRTEALAKYRLIFIKYRWYGDAVGTRGCIKDSIGRFLQRSLGEAGWYDTHAAQ